MKIFYYLPLIFLLNCSQLSNSVLLNNTVLSVSNGFSLTSSAISTGADLVLENKSGKNMLEHTVSKIRGKDCVQDFLTIICD